MGHAPCDPSVLLPSPASVSGVAQRQVGHDAVAVPRHELPDDQMDQLRSRQVEFCAEARQFLVFSLIESHRKATIADFLGRAVWPNQIVPEGKFFQFSDPVRRA